MTVVGEAYVRFKAIDDVTPALTGAASKDADAAGKAAETASGRFRAAMRSMSGSIMSAFGPALQPIQEVVDKMTGVGAAAENMRNKTGKSLLVMGGAATATGLLLTTMGDKDKVSMFQLQKAVENAGGSWEKYRDETEKTDKGQEHYVHTASETAGALNTLVTRTGKVEESYKNMSLVTNLAANRHISLSAAAGIVARVMNGNTRVLRLYGISQDQINKLTDTAGKKAKEHAMTLLQQEDATNKARMMTLKEKDAQIQATLAATKDKGERARLHAVLAQDRLERTKLTDAISKNKDKEKELKDEIKNSTDAHAKGAAAVDLLAKKMKGQADVAADSFTGKMREARAKLEDFAASIGQKVGPAITAAGPAIMGLGAIVESGIVGKMGKGIKMLATWDKQSRIVSADTKVWTAVQWAFNAAMEANPIILVVTAIALLVAAIVLAYMKFKPFRELVNAIGRDIKTIFMDAVNAVVRAFKAFIGFFETVWKTVVNIIKRYGTIILAVVAPFIGIPLLIMQHWKQIEAFFKNLWNTVWNTTSRFIGTILGGISRMWTSAVGFVKRMVSDIINFFAQLPGRAASAIAGIVGRVLSIFGNLASSAINAVHNWIGNTVSYIAGLPGRIVSALGGLAGSVTGAISRGFSNVKNTVMGAVSGAGSWLYNAGTQMVQGFIHGIESMFGSVASAAGNLISHLGGKVLHALGIGSPSKVYANVGKNVAAGLIKGLEDSITAVGRSGERMARAAIHHPSAAELAAHAHAGTHAQYGNVYNLFPNATIKMAEESPQALADRLKFAIQASRM